MVKCPNCSKDLIDKSGNKKLCVQIGNPEIAIVETQDPKFCPCCNSYFLTTDAVVDAILQIKSKKDNPTQIQAGVYC